MSAVETPRCANDSHASLPAAWQTTSLTDPYPAQGAITGANAKNNIYPGKWFSGGRLPRQTQELRSGSRRCRGSGWRPWRGGFPGLPSCGQQRLSPSNCSSASLLGTHHARIFKNEVDVRICLSARPQRLMHAIVSTQTFFSVFLISDWDDCHHICRPDHQYTAVHMWTIRTATGRYIYINKSICSCFPFQFHLKLHTTSASLPPSSGCCLPLP